MLPFAAFVKAPLTPGCSGTKPYCAMIIARIVNRCDFLFTVGIKSEQRAILTLN